ncbi:MAG: hypothetical protein WBF71_02180 [Microthrixaceae bacterium]
MSVGWDLEFDNPFRVAANIFALGIGLFALVILIRRVVSGRGLRWRDLLLLPNIAFDGVAVPLFLMIWLLAEWE